MSVGFDPLAASGGRAAWQEPDMYADVENASKVPSLQGHDQAPTAMESEVFDKDGQVRVKQRHDQRQKQAGSWGKFKGGMRSIWMTKHTEDTENDRELYIQTTLRELIIYIIFLIITCIVTFGMTTSTMFYFTKVMRELFIDSDAGAAYHKTFRHISQMNDFWQFAEGPLLEGLYWEKWYDEKAVRSNETGYIFYENKLLGLPRIRMLKVNDHSCDVPDAFKREVKKCFAPYSEDAEDRQPFGKKNGTGWVYRSSKQLGSATYTGLISTYGGGGYHEDLTMHKGLARSQITGLKGYRWIDRGTRVIFVDFTVYNANINLFCVVKLTLEFPATGGVIPSYSFKTLKLIRYVTTWDFFILICEGIFCAFILYYIVEELIEINRWRCNYFTNFWNLLDVLVILIALCCIGFTIFRQIVVDEKLDELLRDDQKYANFESISFWQSRYNDAVAIMVFFAWIKIFKYISFNKTMNQLSSTLSRCAKDVGGFAVMFFIFFFAYAQLGYLIFGTQVRDFSTFYDAIFTLLRTILGDFDFHELEQANRLLGPVFFISYVFFVFFVLLNMFLAIINDTYAEVKAELATQKNDFELMDYFRRGYSNMMRKTGMKKDRLVDVQAALLSADTDGNKHIDYDEWRHQLKQRGYSEQEIEAMFTKYDMDGDRVLDEEDQRRLAEDLANGTLFGMDDDNDPMTSEGDRREKGLNVSVEEFNVMTRRVDRMEMSVTGVVDKIDAALQQLDALERTKMRHRERMSNLMADVNLSTQTEEEKKRALEQGVQKEMDRFDNDQIGDDGN